MVRRYDRSRAQGRSPYDLDPSDLNFDVDFDKRTVTPKPDWSGRLHPGSDHSRYPSRSASGFDEEDIDPGRRHAQRGPPLGPRGTGPDMTRQEYFEMGERGMDELNDEFEALGMGSNRHSTPGEPHGRRALRRHHVDDIDEFDEEDIDLLGLSTRGGGRRRFGHRYLDDIMDDFDEDDLDRRRPSIKGGLQGRRATAPGYMDEPSTDMGPYVTKAGRESKHQTANLKSRLGELEAQLAKAEEEKERAGGNINRLNPAVYKIFDIKNEIYKIDPDSKHIDGTARFFLHLPKKGDRDHEERGPRHSHPGPTLGNGEDYGRRGFRDVHRRSADHSRYGARPRDMLDDYY